MLSEWLGIVIDVLTIVWLVAFLLFFIHWVRKEKNGGQET